MRGRLGPERSWLHCGVDTSLLASTFVVKLVLALVVVAAMVMGPAGLTDAGAESGSVKVSDIKTCPPRITVLPVSVSPDERIAFEQTERAWLGLSTDEATVWSGLAAGDFSASAPFAMTVKEHSDFTFRELRIQHAHANAREVAALTGVVVEVAIMRVPRRLVIDVAPGFDAADFEMRMSDSAADLEDYWEVTQTGVPWSDMERWWDEITARFRVVDPGQFPQLGSGANLPLPFIHLSYASSQSALEITELIGDVPLERICIEELVARPLEPPQPQGGLGWSLEGEGSGGAVMTRVAGTSEAAAGIWPFEEPVPDFDPDEQFLLVLGATVGGCPEINLDSISFGGSGVLLDVGFYPQFRFCTRQAIPYAFAVLIDRDAVGTGQHPVRTGGRIEIVIEVLDGEPVRQVDNPDPPQLSDALIIDAVGIAASPAGGGWYVDGAGGVYTTGVASFHGSLGGLSINEPIVTMVAHPSGRGY